MPQPVLTGDLDDPEPVGDIDTIDRHAFDIASLVIVGYWDHAPFRWDHPQTRRSMWPDRTVVARRLHGAVRSLG